MMLIFLVGYPLKDIVQLVSQKCILDPRMYLVSKSWSWLSTSSLSVGPGAGYLMTLGLSVLTEK